jgi:hypothetical protein
MPMWNAQNGQGGREEAPEEKQKWAAFRKFVATQRPREGGTFTIPGHIVSMAGDPDDPSKPKMRPGRPGTADKPKPGLDVIVRSDHPDFPGLEWKKFVTLSFFDGHMRDGTMSPFRGGMYGVHYAVTGKQPAQDLVKGSGAFDTDDYIDRPVLLRLIYKGKVEEGSQWYGRRANLTVFLDGFEPLAENLGEWDEDTDGEDVIQPDWDIAAEKRKVAKAQEIKREAVAAAAPKGSQLPQGDTPPWEDELDSVPF